MHFWSGLNDKLLQIMLMGNNNYLLFEYIKYVWLVLHLLLRRKSTPNQLFSSQTCLPKILQWTTFHQTRCPATPTPHMENKSESTADGELTPVVVCEPEPESRTVPTIALEPEPQNESDQVYELATSVPVGVLVEMDSEEWLIVWEAEVELPTLFSPVSSVPLSSLLDLPSIKPVSLPCTESMLSLLIPLPPSHPHSASQSTLPSLVPFSPSSFLTQCHVD